MFEDSFAYLKFKELRKKWDYDVIIETGTYFGESTNEFSKFCDNVITIEINPSCYEWAREYLRHKGFEYCGEEKIKGFLVRTFKRENQTILSYLGNSAEVIDILNLTSYKKPLFFLDAHWEDYLPLKDELKVIGKNYPHSYLIIHDFKVPGKTFKYDTYGENEICFEYIKDELTLFKKHNFFYNDETCGGNKGRGILYGETNE
jgi:hypothetical protein